MEERRGRAGRRQAGRGKWIFHKKSDNKYTNMGWVKGGGRGQGQGQGLFYFARGFKNRVSYF